MNLGSEGKRRKYSHSIHAARMWKDISPQNADDMNSDLQTMALSGTGLVFDKDILIIRRHQSRKTQI